MFGGARYEAIMDVIPKSEKHLLYCEDEELYEIGEDIVETYDGPSHLDLDEKKKARLRKLRNEL